MKRNEMKTKTFRFVTAMILSLMMVVTLIPVSTLATPGCRTITGFEPLETSEFWFDGQPSEKDLIEGIPTTINVYINGSDKVTPIEVTWEVVENYDDSNYYFYSLKPVWSDCYKLSDDLGEMWDVPFITVFRRPVADAKIEEAEPEIDPITETDESKLEPVYTEEEGTIHIDIAGLLGDSVYGAELTNTEKVYNYLTKNLGLNKASVCGIMTNIYAESGMIPNNLENTYNKKFGLTDEEYTARVDKGKGEYKTSSGAKRNFRTDYCGYGLCQWTSLGRRDKLMDKALERKTSVSNIDMQLDFMAEEMENSYPAVWKTLTSVPNNSAGAYLAAQHFCLAYEIPANTVSVAALRAKTTLAGYWKTYSGKSATTSGESYLGLCGYSYPDTLKKGKGMTCSGYAISNYNITSLTLKILDNDGKALYTKTVKPNATAYNLYKLDDYMKFSKLSNGKYTYSLSATDSSGKKITASHKFTIAASGVKALRGFTTSNLKEDASSTGAGEGSSANSSSGSSGSSASSGTNSGNSGNSASISEAVSKDPASTLKITNYNYPSSLKKGKRFSIKGTIKSNYKIKKVYVGIFTSKGKVKYKSSKTFAVRPTSYDLKKVDNDMKFRKLPKGTYYYKVQVTDEKQTKMLVNKKFKVY